MELNYDSCAVTGGAGFIGSHLCEQLVAQGKRVVCIDNLVAGKKENISFLEEDPRFSFVQADVADLPALVEAFKGIEIVFHNAASKNTVCREDPWTDLRVNAWGSWCVAEAARLNDVEKVVHASTGSVYGELVENPQTESHPIGPRSFYGTSKLAGEAYWKAFDAYYGKPRASIIRYFHVYGPRQDSSDTGGVIPIFIRRALAGEPLVIFGDGSQVRSFTYVIDDVEANLVLANSASADGQAYNAASGIKVTVLELAEKVLQVMGRTDLEIKFEEWRPGDIKNFDVDNSKIKALGAEFPTSFEEGLRSTIEWYRHALS